MFKRHLEQIVFSKDYGRQMRFIAGPRQCGKTTLALNFLKSIKCESLYYNWDNRKIRDLYIDNNHFFSNDLNQVESGKKKWLCFDEIHKYPKWKNILKDFFDSYGNDAGFIVTGSAKLDLFRKSGDSLAGRYFLFHLNPLILSEISSAKKLSVPPVNALDWIEDRLAKVKYYDQEMLNLLEYSGFPEPLITQTKKFHNKWRLDYIDRIIREDFNEISQLFDLENIAVLMKLLPSKTSSPLSVNSLSENMKCSFGKIKNYLNLMELGCLIFKVPPYNKNIARAISKENKVYLYDWTKIDDLSKRFENYIAMELKTLTDLWSDAGEYIFTLNYIRTRDGKETDFVILKDNSPWLLIEVKLNRSTVDYHHIKNQEILKVPFIQIVMQNHVAEKINSDIYQMSASRFLV